MSVNENEYQKYLFVDMTGKCFESYQDGTGASDDEGELRYRDSVGAWLRGGREFEVGDMMVFRDELIEAGFEWGVDFYVKKV